MGVGLRWKSPLGPLKIDIAHAVKKESFDKKQLIFFGMSTRF
jgi:outer membrane protein assembly factor BamA